GHQEPLILPAVLFNLIRLIARTSRTLERSSAASFGERMPAKSRIDPLPARRFITSVKLSPGSFRAASLVYASSEMDMFRVPIRVHTHMCVPFTYVFCRSSHRQPRQPHSDYVSAELLTFLFPESRL